MDQMTGQKLAIALDGLTYDDFAYRSQEMCDLYAQAKAAGLVVIHGMSDDLCELHGALDEEISCFGGGSIFIDQDGLIENKCDEEDCPYFKAKRDAGHEIKILWSHPDTVCAWTCETALPHFKFTIFEDDEPWCEAIVLSLADCKKGVA